MINFLDILAYVHDLNPVILPISDAFAIRWYGLAYIIGFVLGFLVLRSLSRRDLWNLKEEKIADFVTFVAIFGVLLGARLGYILFYTLREQGVSILWKDPMMVFSVWNGGMSSHGGLIGVVVFVLVYAYRNKLSALGLLDGLAIVAPLGIFCGRIANFINGELYGRVTQGLAWAMKFPNEIMVEPGMRLGVMKRLNALGSPLAENYPYISRGDLDAVLKANINGDPVVKEALGDILPDRHPSQLYEALAEGVFIFAILYFIRIKFPGAREGLFSGLFCILYAIGRISVEYYREPDARMVGAFTMGQFLSLFLIVVGVALLLYSWKSGGKREPLQE